MRISAFEWCIHDFQGRHGRSKFWSQIFLEGTLKASNEGTFYWKFLLWCSNDGCTAETLHSQQNNGK